MSRENIKRIEKLEHTKSLSLEEYEALIRERDEVSTQFLRERAVAVRRRYYQNHVFIRGLIEISNICKNDCYYCGIRKSNHLCDRYRLTEEEILSCCEAGYELGFRTFVLQGGEDGYFTDERLEHLIRGIKSRYPDCAVTLSLGERSRQSYQRLYESGADRYLLRHETADPAHYRKLHPEELSWENRMRCLEQLKEIGYQAGCGFMVGSPYQTAGMMAADLKYIERSAPDMCGIGPFIPHQETPFAGYAGGDADLVCFLLSVIRLIRPTILLPATTALSTIAQNGRERGILSGANVVMPNLSPMSVRKKYELYANKAYMGEESAQSILTLRASMESIGYEVVIDRGDRIQEN